MQDSNPLTEVRGGNILQNPRLVSASKCNNCSLHVRYNGIGVAIGTTGKEESQLLEDIKVIDQCKAYLLSPGRWPQVTHSISLK